MLRSCRFPATPSPRSASSLREPAAQSLFAGEKSYTQDLMLRGVVDGPSPSDAIARLTHERIRPTRLRTEVRTPQGLKLDAWKGAGSCPCSLAFRSRHMRVHFRQVAALDSLNAHCQIVTKRLAEG